MKDLQLIEHARQRWAESGRSPDQFWRILPPLYPPYTTYGDQEGWPWPRTMREAVEQLILRTNIGAKRSLIQQSDEDRAWLHLSPGMWIRNTFGLWEGNDPLAKAIELYQLDKTLLNLSVHEVERLYAETFGDKEPERFADALSGPICDAFLEALQSYEFPELTGNWDEVRFA